MCCCCSVCNLFLIILSENDIVGDYSEILQSCLTVSLSLLQFLHFICQESHITMMIKEKNALNSFFLSVFLPSPFTPTSPLQPVCCYDLIQGSTARYMDKDVLGLFQPCKKYNVTDQQVSMLDNK